MLRDFLYIIIASSRKYPSMSIGNLGIGLLQISTEKWQPHQMEGTKYNTPSHVEVFIQSTSEIVAESYSLRTKLHVI